MTALIRAEGLMKAFPNPLDAKQPIRAADGISLALDAGDRLIAMTGPDGAGKSTFMRLLCGLEAPDAGFIEVLGQTPDPDDETFAGRIAFMPQTLGLYRNLTCGENLEVFAGLRGFEGEESGLGALEKRIAELLEMTGLGPFSNRQAGRLSGGMKQKLALASALLRIPDLLILDEPTVGVDPLSRRELWAVVREMLARTEMRCIFSTAYLEEAEAADRVLLFEGGRIIENRTPAEYLLLARGRTFEKPLAAHSETAARKVSCGLAAAAADPHALLLDAVPRRGAAAVTAWRLPDASEAEALAAQGFRPRTAVLEDAYALLTFAPHEASASPALNLDEGLRSVQDAALPDAGSAGEAPPIVIRAEGISRVFGNFVAVAHTSFAVRRGEIFGLLGPNGAGKTTTFRMLCGLLAPSGGEIEVAGCDLRLAKSEARARIGYVAQKFSLYGRLTCEQNLRYFGRSYGFSGRTLEARTSAMLADFGLESRRHTPAASMPFGAMRDLSMACGLIHNPAILFLDEATSGADLASRRAFWRRINLLADAGTTVVVTTHFLEEAEYCDRFLIQDAGKVLALGTPREVKAAAAQAPGAALRPETMSIEDAFIAIVEAARKQESQGEKA